MEGEWWFAIQMASRLRMSPSDHSRKGLYAGQSGSSVDQGIDSWLLSRSEITIPKWSIRVEKKCSLPILRVNSPCAHQSKHDWSFKKHSLRIKGIGGSGLKIYNHKSAGIEIHHFKRRLSLQFHWFRKLIDPQDVFNGEEVFVAKQSEKVVKEVVSTAEVSAATTITTEENTLAQALAELRSAKPKIVVKDKGKGKMVEEEPMEKMSNKELLKLDEELAFKLQAEEEEQARLVREKAEKVEEANISWDNVQAMIGGDRKKHFAALRAQEKRNKPPTKAQKKSTMSTYLKNMVGYKQSQLKNKSFVEIQKLFDKAMTRVNMFVDKDTELVKQSSNKAEAEMA
ncbi:hypothetical protein Tco_0506679 [Tanacetum coccineum]